MWLIIKLSSDSGAERKALALIATAGRACLPSGEPACECICSFPHHQHPLSHSLIPNRPLKSNADKIPILIKNLFVDHSSI